MKFNELSEEAKEKAIENSRYDFCDHFDGRDLIDSLNCVLEEKYGVNIHTMNGYDLYNKELDIDFKILGDFLSKNKSVFSRGEYLVIKNQSFENQYLSAKWWNHCLHGESILSTITCVYCGCMFDTCDCFEKGFFLIDGNIDYVVEDAEASLKSLFSDMCSFIYESLSADYDYLSSDEYILECFEINDYDFDENGNIE